MSYDGTYTNCHFHGSSEMILREKRGILKIDLAKERYNYIKQVDEIKCELKDVCAN